MPRIGSNAWKQQVLDSPAYPAVTVTTFSGCCAAAKSLEGRIMLASEAQVLPLRDCDNPSECKCRYRKFPDRRLGEEDRRFPYLGQRAGWYTASERRETRGRREEDE